MKVTQRTALALLALFCAISSLFGQTEITGSRWVLEAGLDAKAMQLRGEVPRYIKTTMENWNAGGANIVRASYRHLPLPGLDLHLGLRGSLSKHWGLRAGLGVGVWTAREEMIDYFPNGYPSNPEMSAWVVQTATMYVMGNLPLSVGYQAANGRHGIFADITPHIYMGGRHRYRTYDRYFDGREILTYEDIAPPAVGSDGSNVSYGRVARMNLSAGLHYEHRFPIGKRSCGLTIGAQANVTPLLSATNATASVLQWWLSDTDILAANTGYYSANLGFRCDLLKLGKK